MDGGGGTTVKELTFVVDVKDNKVVKADNIIDELEKSYGVGSVLAVVPRSGNLFDVTVKNKELVDDLCSSGLHVSGRKYDCNAIYSSHKLVSFMHLPVFIEDEELIGRLTSLGVELKSPIKRRKYPGTNVEDGTRFVVCKFPPNITSLPYSLKVEIDKDRFEYVRVKHDNQAKVCTKCYSDDHLYANCPLNKCYRCNTFGHLARNCDNIPCQKCKYIGRCECGDKNEAFRPENAKEADLNVDREFARVNRERKRKQNEENTQSRDIEEMSESVQTEPDVKIQKVNQKSDDVKESNGDNVSSDIADVVVHKTFDGSQSTKVDGETIQKLNSDKISDLDYFDEVAMNTPLQGGPFSQDSSKLGDVKSSSEVDAATTGLPNAEAAESMDDDDDDSNLDLNSEADMEEQNLDEAVKIIKRSRRRRLVTSLNKSLAEIAKLSRKSTKKLTQLSSS